MSKGPTPPNRLPTSEELTRGPMMSDRANDFSHYLTDEEAIKRYKADTEGKSPQEKKRWLKQHGQGH